MAAFEVKVVRWEEPPDHGNRRRRRSVYEALVDELRAKPGLWAVVAEGLTTGSAGSLANRIKMGKGPFAPPRSFEARSIGAAGADDASVYARFVGEQVPDAQP